jgi:outer membrane murein-binding lipoprotein Lpp
MLKTSTMALAVAAALGLSGPAFAQTSDDLREQVRQLRKRTDELEKRVRDAEEAANQAAQASNRPASENALNPGVSLILNGVYSNLSRSPADFRINGFVPTLGEVEPFPRGFSLGESEIAVAANIDHNFRGTGIFSISPNNEIGAEEAYIQTLSLSKGFTVKAGRFFSGVGYLNQIHAHAWDFTDAPLANKVFLGNQLAEDGVQLKWVAPTDTYFDLGLELGRGRAFPAAAPEGASRDKNGVGSANAFTHVGGDFGSGFAWQTGLSYLRTSPRDRTFGDVDSMDTPVIDSFSGQSRLWALSGVLKWAPNYNPTQTSFKLQGEYFRRRENGDLTFDTQTASSGPRTDAFASRQSGWYLQGVYQFMPVWRVGYRYDRLDAGTQTIGLVDSGALAAADFPILARYNPARNTVMVDWSASEFSRVRLQFARDLSRRNEPDNQVFLQYIVSLGVHGAHTF